MRKPTHLLVVRVTFYTAIFVQYENSTVRDGCEIWSCLYVSSDGTASSNTRIQSELELKGR